MYKRERHITLNCLQVRQRIPDFTNYGLSGLEARAVVEHCHDCPECMDELKLVFLVNTCLEDSDDNDKRALAEANLEERFEEIAARINYINMINRNMMFFLLGASVFLFISMVIELLL
ncbi:MAG: hypothetical protein Q4P30_04575 [Eubacteriales bacterium]|nr:hypothetical protein [Eubacteriales bacterium]